jgi:hypothetical protein
MRPRMKYSEMENYQAASMVKFLSYVAWGVGLVYTIITSVTLDYVSVGARAGQFFFGLLLTLPAGGIPYALAHILSLLEEIRSDKISKDKDIDNTLS